MGLIIENSALNEIATQAKLIATQNDNKALIDLVLIIISACAGGFFAAWWSSWFASKRRMAEKRRDKYYLHKNTIIQLEHEIIPARIRIGKNLTITNSVQKDSTDSRVRIPLRLYSIDISSKLSLNILNLGIINDYLNLFTLLEKINSDIQYLEGVAKTIQDGVLRGDGLALNLASVYIEHIKLLEVDLKKADDDSRNLLSKIKIIIKLDDDKYRDQYLEDGKEIKYRYSESSIKKASKKILDEEDSDRHPEDKSKFVTPYIDIIIK